jgi:hypothetical protein
MPTADEPHLRIDVREYIDREIHRIRSADLAFGKFTIERLMALMAIVVSLYALLSR